MLPSYQLEHDEDDIEDDGNHSENEHDNVEDIAPWWAGCSRCRGCVWTDRPQDDHEQVENNQEVEIQWVQMHSVSLLLSFMSQYRLSSKSLIREKKTCLMAPSRLASLL